MADEHAHMATIAVTIRAGLAHGVSCVQPARLFRPVSSRNVIGSCCAASSRAARRCLVLPFINTVKHRGRRGARVARREEGEYREYLTDEQRREAGCIAGRMPPYL